MGLFSLTKASQRVAQNEGRVIYKVKPNIVQCLDVALDTVHSFGTIWDVCCLRKHIVYSQGIVYYILQTTSKQPVSGLNAV